jgi:hypothetical protein
MIGRVHVGLGLAAIRSVIGRLYAAALFMMCGLLIARALAGAGMADLVHQSIGTVIVAGLIWFLELVVKAYIADSAKASLPQNVPDLSPAP